MNTTVHEKQLTGRGIPEFVTKPQAARYCGCTLDEFEELLASGDGPRVKNPTGVYCFLRADLNEYMRTKLGLVDQGGPKNPPGLITMLTN